VINFRGNCWELRSHTYFGVGTQFAKFGRLILIPDVATRCPILKIKCARFDSTPKSPIAGYKGTYF